LALAYGQMGAAGDNGMTAKGISVPVHEANFDG
jgi:hypothetical protein